MEIDGGREGTVENERREAEKNIFIVRKCVQKAKATHGAVTLVETEMRSVSGFS